MMRRAAGAVGALWALSLGTSPAVAQSSERSVSLSADTVEVGQVFELQVRLPVPPGSVVYFPDSVAAASVLESFAPAEWRAEPAADGGASLILTYPLMAFGAGTVPVPGIDVFMRPMASGATGDPLPGGSIVGDADDMPRGPQAALFATRIPRQAVWVEPVLTTEDFLRGVDPMPPDDVVGGSWNWPAVALILLFSSVLGGAVVTTTRTWLAARPHDGRGAEAHRPLTRAEARLWALDELDRLLAEDGWGRMRDLYSESSGIVRTYVQRFDPDWGPALTSSELMGRLDTSTREEAGSGLLREMRTAEAVKFGRLAPEGPEARGHLETLRAWVDASGGGQA